MVNNNQDEAREVVMVWERPEATEVDFHGAAIIDEWGREIPITEDMVQRAFQELGFPNEDAAASTVEAAEENSSLQ